MTFHGVDMQAAMKRMREGAPETFRAFLAFDKQAFEAGALPTKTKELIAVAIAHITQCPWCIDAHVGRARGAGATPQELSEATFVAMAMAAGAAWSHGGLALHALHEHEQRAAAK